MSASQTTVEAFSPARITGFFMIFQGGSTGAGVNLSEGAVTKVSLSNEQSEPEIVINGSDIEARVSRRVYAGFARELAGRRVIAKTTTSFPVGYGLGMSGAGAFSLSLALNAALGGAKSYQECAQIATEAEIFCGTGLGTVMNQQFCGFLIGNEPYPSKSSRQIPCSEDTVVCCFLNPIETGSIIRNHGWKERINTIGQECMLEINRDPTIKNFTLLARHFALSTGLANESLRQIMDDVKVACMAMLGQTLFAVVHKDEAPEVEARFKKYSARTQVSALGQRPAMVISPGN
jgi:pantoate kinase